METKSYFIRFTNLSTKQSFGLVFCTDDIKTDIRKFASKFGVDYTLDDFHILPNHCLYIVHPYCSGSINDLDNLVDYYTDQVDILL